MATKSSVYDFLLDNGQQVLLAPTARQVADHFGISVSTAHYYIRQLQRDFLVERVAGRNVNQIVTEVSPGG